MMDHFKIFLSNIIEANREDIDDEESRASLTVPLHGVQLGTNQFILLYDLTYAVKGHIALSMPCDARNPQAPLFHILVGRSPDLAPAAVG